MKAVLLRNYGGVNQLEYTEADDPKLQAGEVLVKLIATSVNPIDYKLREGAMKARMELQFPAILGRDLSGEVVALGEGVTRFKVGDRVMGLVHHAYAELVACKADVLTLTPDGLDPVTAGALPLVLTTGAELMERGVRPQHGQTVLVTGAVGSVGRTAIYVAKQHKCKVIAGVRSKQRSEAQQLEADQVLALDDENEMAGLGEVDAVADTVGGETARRLAGKVKKPGIFASVVGEPEAAKQAGVEVRAVWSEPNPERLHDLAIAVRDGKLVIPVSKRLQLSQIRDAHSEAEHQTGGKIILVP